MRKIGSILCFSGLSVLMLAVFLFSPWMVAGHASAHVATVRRQAVGRDTTTAKNIAQWGWGKVIVVSLSHQEMEVFNNGHEVYDTLVTTGRPKLPTPTGSYRVFFKQSPIVFRSPFPRKSPNWYAPTHVKYALEWKAGGYFIHDAWWHTTYGPGSNLWHYDPVYGWQWGSHGCIAVPLNAMIWLYHWATVGTTVRVIR